MKVFSAEIAARRFGLLDRDGHVSGDPQTALLRQIENPDAARLDGPGAMSLSEIQDYNRERSEQFKARREAITARIAAGSSDMQDIPVPEMTVRSIGDILGSELDIRLAKARSTDTPFVERLALFWMNVLTVSVERGNVGVYAVAFEREAVRPNLLRRFPDMLIAAATHPAMLLYLDNATSCGPNSTIGLKPAIAGKPKRGINENLARETLELHTLGADGGYTQRDVEELAKVLTGWSNKLRTRSPVPAGAWQTFDERLHEPGPKTILGKTYRQDGPAQLVAVLHDLARHRATARHMARRLSLHFIGEDCPPSLTAELEKTFRETDGHLPSVYKVLLTDENSLSLPARSLRSPFEHLLVISRLLGWEPKPGFAQAALRALGQPYFRAPSPAGWPEKVDDWASPLALKRRLDFAYGVAAQVDNRIDPRALAQEALGPWLSPALARAIERAPSTREGVALLLMSPEVIRR